MQRKLLSTDPKSTLAHDAKAEPLLVLEPGKKLDLYVRVMRHPPHKYPSQLLDHTLNYYYYYNHEMNEHTMRVLLCLVII